MASGKTLSTGTMNLRFMQNALRAQQIQAAELPKAEIKDDGQWEVPQAVRDAWGLTSNSKSRDSDVHEESYLPFLFQADEDDAAPSSSGSSSQVKGRRVFGKHGKELEGVKTSEETTTENSGTPVESPEHTNGRKIHPRPVAISGKSGGFLRGFDQLEKSSKPKKSAKDMVFESGGVGSDLRSVQKSSDETSAGVPAPGSTTGFLKPAGVDAPASAREPKPKRKREANTTAESSRERPKKNKKLKQAPS
ncbi:hypothetical protein H1R20_g15176, partial [Candolleomyces eurysporus]